MADITLSKAVRSNLLSLQNTSNLLAKTQERLATGLKVNSALDNPTNFFTSSALSSRANDLGRLLDSISNANQTIEAADNGLTAITKLVESAQATARQALQTSATVETTTAATSASLSSSSFSAVDLTNSASSATSGSLTATFGGALNFDDPSDQLNFTIEIDGGGTANITIDQARLFAAGNADFVIDDETELAAAVVSAINAEGTYTVNTDLTVGIGSGFISFNSLLQGTGSTVAITGTGVVDAGGANTLTNTSGIADNTDAGAAAVLADSISFDLTVGTTTQSITLDNTITNASGATAASDIVNAINSQFGSNVASVSGGEIVITDSTTGTSSTVTIANLTTSGNATTSGLSNNTDSGSAASTTTSVNPKRDEFVSTYNSLLTQIDDLAKDAGFNGVNLLSGDDLSVLFNEDGSSNLDITGVTFDSAGLSLSAVASGGFDDNDDINTTLDTLSAAIDSLRAQSSKFGSNLSVVETRQNFTKETINTLETGAANLTLADSNEEAANLLALQTRQQLSSTSLSLASQADQQVLRLF